MGTSDQSLFGNLPGSITPTYATSIHILPLPSLLAKDHDEGGREGRKKFAKINCEWCAFFAQINFLP